MRHRGLTTVLGAAALASVVAATGMAQGGPGRMGERGWGMWGEDGMGMWRGGPFGRWSGRGPDWMLERLEGRLSFLKTELKITEAQMPAWNEFTQAVRSAVKQRNERMKAAFSTEEKARTLPDRIEAQEQFMTARLEEVKLIKASVRNLYAVLSDEQKKEADEMVIPMVGMGGPGWAM